MTMSKDHGDFEFSCDGCTEVLHTETSNFDAAKNLLARSGWRARKILGDWQHFCPRCN